MKYSTKQLAQRYCHYLSQQDFDVDINMSQPCDLSTYNEYTYQKLMLQYDRLYQHTDTLQLTEQFLKGD